MTQATKAYISWVAAMGSLAIGAAVSECQFTHPVRFPIYFALAVLTSVVKFRIPETPGTFSCSSLFAILAVAELDLAEAVIIACGAGAGQTLLNVREKPSPVQLIFNTAALGISTAAAAWVKTIATGFGILPPLVITLTAAGFYAADVLLVAGILKRVQKENGTRTVRMWLLRTVPLFLISAAAAVALFLIDPMFQRGFALLLVPGALALQVCYTRLLVSRRRPIRQASYQQSA